MNLRSKKIQILSIAVFCLLLANFTVLILLGFYNHPTGDDYYYGVTTRAVIEAGGSALQVLAAALEGVKLQYQIWQGTYSAMFFMYLSPNIWGEQFYHLVTPVILFTFALGVFYLISSLMVDLAGKYKGATFEAREMKWRSVLVGSLLCMLCILTNPFPGESLYWYNGSMYYTWYFSLTLLYIGMVIRYLCKHKKRYIILLPLLSLFLAGGNYVSLLPCILIIFSITVLKFGMYHVQKSSILCRDGVFLLLLFLLLVLGLCISAMAPGNQMREANLWDKSAVRAVLKAIRQGFRYMGIWCNFWWFAFLLFVTPLLRYVYDRVSFRFPCPFLVAPFLFGLFCSMSCPTLYAENSTGPGRALAIIYYGFQIFSFLTYAYVLGYFHRVWKKETPSYVQSGCLAGACVFLLLALFTGRYSECTSFIAFDELSSKRAAAYEAEYQSRLELLARDDIKDVEFLPYENQPAMLYVGDLAQDSTLETNAHVAEYFHKDSICVIYDR